MTNKSASKALTAPVLSEVEASALTALLTAGLTPDADAFTVESAADAALVNVDSCRVALWNARGKAAAILGAPRWGMTVAVFAAVEAGATRAAIAQRGGMDVSIVGQYARYPERLAAIADALTMPRVNAYKDAALVEELWSRASRLSVDAFAALVAAVEALVATSDPTDADAPTPMEYVTMAAATMGAKRGSRKDAAVEPEPETVEPETVEPVTGSAILAAVELLRTVSRANTANAVEALAIAEFVRDYSAGFNN